jgi:alpha-tubulin suppressor-like RCC1 family protein
MTNRKIKLNVGHNKGAILNKINRYTKLNLWLLPVALILLLGIANAVHAQTAQTITNFSPTTPIVFSTGRTIALTATGGGSGNPVTFTSATTSICTVSGVTATVLSVGTCTLNANQAGNASFSAAPQVARSVVVNKGSQTITFATLAAKSFEAAPFTVSATASSALAVTFTSTTTPVCTVSGSTVTLVTIGTCTIAANQAGNTNFNAATQVTQSFTVNKGSQTITFATLAAKSFEAAPFTVSATASSALAVVFTSTTTPICTVSGSTVTLVAIGTCTIAANQAGNTNFNAATQVTQSFTVSKGSQTITFGALTSRSFGEAPFTVSATASSALTIIFTSTTTPICTVSGNTVTLVTIGTCTIAANQAGNTNFNAAAQLTQSFAVSKANQTITFGALTGRAFGAAPFAVSATASSGLAVAFTSTTAAICSVSGLNVTILSVGTCTITANQAGNTNYNAAPQITQSFAVSKASQTITFTALSNKTFGDAPFTVSATASSALAVSFTSTTNSICTLAGSTVTIVSAGTCTVAANQAGNTNFNAATQVTQSFTVAKANQTITFAALANKTLGNPAFTISASTSSGLVVSFSSSTTSVCTVSGSTVSLVSAGTCTIAANRVGNANFNAATAVTQSFTVAPAALIQQTITGFSPASPVQYSVDSTFGLSATGGASGNAVVFASTTPAVCTVASSTVSIVSVGTCTLTANQAGNATYSAAPQVSAAVTITKANQTITFAALPSKLLASMPFAINATATSNLAVTFSSATSAVCTVASNTVSLISVGTCTINANQAGNGNYNAAPQVTQSFNLVNGISAIYSAPLALGQSHTCAINSSSGLKCWGWNELGQLGDNTVVDRYTPVDVQGLNAGVVAVSAGVANTCAITTAGGVKCWGDNYYGQLGNNTTAQQNTPVDVVGLQSGVVAISAGGTHTCVITIVGGVKCWGDNTYGQLGDGTGIGQAIPVDVFGLDSGVIDIRSGSYHTCAITTAGQLKCWGANFQGQLADGTTSSQYIPITVANFSPSPIGVESGYYHSCALTTLGGVKCWGYNGYGQIGAGDYDNRLVPTDVVGLSSGISAIANGYYTSCGITTTGQLKCWGSNVASNVPVNNSTFIDGVIEVGLGNGHTCVMITGGGVRCWGSNNYGQVGNGTTDYQSSPTPPIGLAGTVGITQTINFPPLPEQNLGDVAVYLNASSTSTLPVTFASMTNAVCTVADNFANFVTLGTCTITASQLGDGNYGAAASVTRSFNVLIGTQTITNFAPTTPIIYSTNYAFYLSAQGGGSNNPVTFASTTPSVCTFMTPYVYILTPGTCTLTANQAGNASYTSAPQVTATVIIEKAPQTITFWPFSFDLLPRVVTTPPLAIEGYASSGLVVDYTSTTPAVCTVQATTLTLNGVGTCTINANQMGNNFYNAAPTVTRSFQATLATQSITQFSSTTAINYSLGAVFTLSATPGASGNPVVFASTSASVCSVSGNTVTVLSAGTCSLTASQAGNALYVASPTLSSIVIINVANQAIIIGSLANKSPNSAPFMVTATSTANLPVLLSTTTPSVCTFAAGTVTILAAGTCTIAANQAGNSNINAASQVTRSFMVAAMPPRLVTISLPDAVIGEPYNALLTLGTSTPLSVATVSGLPAGLVATQNSSGAITLSGTPTADGVFTLTVNASNADGTISPTIGLAVAKYADNVSMMSAGYQHTCAVISGGVQCWGSNNGGQLGNNSQISSVIPVTAIVIGSGATHVSAGRGHTCAVTNGQVLCWGDNSSGQLGINNRQSSTFPRQIFRALPGGASSVVTGEAHTCAVANGRVHCWGSNRNGQVYGYNENVNSTFPGEITAVGANIVTIAAGYRHNCAVTNSGGLKCWGDNTFGQLGTGNTTNGQVFDTFPANSGVSNVAAGEHHTCAIVNGGVQCWGRNSYGQLGNATFTDSLLPVSAIPANSGVTAITASALNTCAVVNGGLQCWGDSLVPLGPIGANASSQWIKLPTTIYPANSGVSSISSGEGHICAIVNGRVQCWGNNSSGQLGNIHVPRSLSPVTAIASSASVKSPAAGNNHTCAVINSSVQCWGASRYGQLGNSAVSQSLTPMVVSTASSGVSMVSSGSGRICAVVNGGTQCWGLTYQAQRGFDFIGENAGSLTPIPAGSNITSVATGNSHECYVANGGVQCRGYGYNGQLGTSNGYFGGSNADINVALSVASSVTAIAAGAFHNCAIVNGGLQCWGSNNNGQLGDNSLVTRLLPTPILPTTSNVTAIAASSNHSCAIVNGGVQCWGANDSGQLGNATTVASLTPVTALPTTSNATAIAVGERHSCAVVNSGVMCWGANDVGQLGNGTTTASTIPIVTIPAGSNVLAVTSSTGGNHTCAVVNDGLVCWGDNTLGQLADANTYYLRKVAAAIQPITAAIVPSAPFISFGFGGAGIATLSFTPSTSNGGSDIINYTATCTAMANPTLNATIAANATTAVVSGLLSGVTYSCSMTANNAVGSSAPSNSVTATSTTRTVPVAPTLTTAIATLGGGTLTFAPPINNGGSAVTSYVARCIASGNTTITASVSASNPPSNTSISVTNMNGGVAYNCQIAAINIMGTGAYSNTLVVTPLAAAIPAAPTISTAVAIAGGAILNFTAPNTPPNNGGAAITSIVATCAAAGQATRTASLAIAAPPAAMPASITVTNMTSAIAYVCTLTATNSAGISTASNALNVTPVSSAPTVSITAPANNAIVNAPVTITIAAAVPMGAITTLTKVEIFADTTLINTITSNGNTTLNTDIIWATPTPGSYSLTAKVTDSSNQTTTSTPINITVRAKPSISLNTLSNFYLAPAGIDLFATASANATPGIIPPPPTPTIVSVEIIATNTATSQVINIATLTTQPYTHRWQNVPQGSYSVTAKATDSNGASTTTAPITITVGLAAGLNLAPQPSLNGSSTIDTTFAISGSYQAPPNSAVTINGQLATLTEAGQFFINNVPLAVIGNNLITITLTTQDGNTTTQTLTITRLAPPPPPVQPPVQVPPLPPIPIPAIYTATVGEGGIFAPSPNTNYKAPITVSILNGVPPLVGTTLSISCAAGSPATPRPVANTETTVNCLYPENGLYQISVTINNQVGGVIYAAVKQVKVENPLEKIRIVRGVYSDLIDRLKASNKTLALNLFFGHARDKYDAVFTAFGVDLAANANQLGGIARVTASLETAELILTRTDAGGTTVFSVTLFLGEDGIWRIEGM